MATQPPAPKPMRYTLASCPAMLVKMLFTLVPDACTAPNATSAINATSNAYSSRSCPYSSFAIFKSCSTILMGIS